jgi:hypothetical protein
MENFSVRWPGAWEREQTIVDGGRCKWTRQIVKDEKNANNGIKFWIYFQASFAG